PPSTLSLHDALPISHTTAVPSSHEPLGSRSAGRVRRKAQRHNHPPQAPQVAPAITVHSMTVASSPHPRSTITWRHERYLRVTAVRSGPPRGAGPTTHVWFVVLRRQEAFPRRTTDAGRPQRNGSLYGTAQQPGTAYAVACQVNTACPVVNAPDSDRELSAAAGASSATTGTIAENPAAATSSGFQPTIGCPARTTSPLATWTVNPEPCCFTVSIPRCTNTARPSSPATTNACGCNVATVPAMGATASSCPLPGRTATPGPTIASANTGSSTSVIGAAVPETGLPTTSSAALTAGPRCHWRCCRRPGPRSP